MSDNEVEEIQKRKLKEKGAKVVEERAVEYDPEKILFMLIEYVNKYGLDLMNVSSDLKTQIVNLKQKKLNEQNNVK